MLACGQLPRGPAALAAAHAVCAQVRGHAASEGDSKGLARAESIAVTRQLGLSICESDFESLPIIWPGPNRGPTRHEALAVSRTGGALGRSRRHRGGLGRSKREVKDRQRPEPLELSFRTRRGLRELTALVGGPASTGGRSESASKELLQAPPALL